MTQAWSIGNILGVINSCKILIIRKSGKVKYIGENRLQSIMRTQRILMKILFSAEFVDA